MLTDNVATRFRLKRRTVDFDPRREVLPRPRTSVAQRSVRVICGYFPIDRMVQYIGAPL
jgi:hypothetical protein